jgi:hypothetical protein
VSCPSIPATSATLRITPAATTRRGSIVLPSGGTGTTLVGDAGLAPQMIATLANDGLMVVEVAWQQPGIWGVPQARTQACRFATAARWIYDNLHGGARLFALQGTSGASSQIAFGLAHYDLADVVDLANLGSGPLKCPLCPVDARAPEPLLPGPAPSVNRDPQLNYPRTTVRVFLGQAETASDIIADANAYFGAVTSAKSKTTIPATGHHIEDTQNGIDAYIESVRGALR